MVHCSTTIGRVWWKGTRQGLSVVCDGRARGRGMGDGNGWTSSSGVATSANLGDHRGGNRSPAARQCWGRRRVQRVSAASTYLSLTQEPLPPRPRAGMDAACAQRWTLGNGEPGRRRIESVVLAVRTGDVEFAARAEERAHCFMNRGAPVENSAVSVKEKKKRKG
jgi:hypothetical protein